MLWRRILVGVLVAPVAVILAIVGFVVLSSKDDRVTDGAAYGFVVGESAQQSYDRALELERRGKIAEFRLGHGSSAFLMDPAQHDVLNYPKWVMVVGPDWWVNDIYLTFDDRRLVEIRRVRVCCEGP